MTNWNLTHESQKKYRTSRTTDHPDGSADFLIKIGEHKRFYHAFCETEYEQIALDTGLHIQYEFGERNSLVTFAQ